jgi:hypothetical protein
MSQGFKKGLKRKGKERGKVRKKGKTQTIGAKTSHVPASAS